MYFNGNKTNTARALSPFTIKIQPSLRHMAIYRKQFNLHCFMFKVSYVTILIVET